MSLHDALLAKAFGGGGSGGVSSWNDLTDKPFYSEIVEILPETTVEIDPEAGMGLIPAEFTFEAGNEYTITYNGVEYVVSNGMETDDGFFIGNLGAINESMMTEEPFCLSYTALGEDDSGNPIYGLAIFALDGSATVTLSIVGEVVTKIPEKYIPEGNTVFFYGTAHDFGVTQKDIVLSAPNDKIIQAVEANRDVILRIYNIDGTGSFCDCRFTFRGAGDYNFECVFDRYSARARVCEVHLTSSGDATIRECRHNFDTTN